MQFRVGDKVRVASVESDVDALRGYVGSEGTIVDKFPFGRVLYTVEFADWNQADAWDEELELIEAATPVPAAPTPRIDPTIITRLNEVVTMLTKAKRTASRRRSYCVGLVNRFADYHEGHRKYAQERLDVASAEHDNIVARIEALSKVIEELTKEER